MITDTALLEREAKGCPIRVGMVGAGATGRAIALQLGTPAPGIRLVAIANRTVEHGERAFREAGITEWSLAETAFAAKKIISRGVPVLTDDPSVLTNCDVIDILVEVTGTVETAAHVVLEAFEHGKHVVLVNCELDSLLGPILKVKADQAGVVLTNTDGDEPGVAMTLLRYLRSLGLRPVAAGNLKGMIDYYRTPETQQAFAAKNGQDARKSLLLQMLRNYPWRRRFLPTRRISTLAGVACMALPVSMSGRWRTCCLLTRCLILGSSTMPSVQHRTPALS